MTRFADIPGRSDYCVGDDGSVWSHKRGRWKKLKQRRDPKHGYMTVELSGGKRGIRKACLVHRLVLETFVGPCPPGMEARHFPDRDKTNNCLDNLSWGTNEQNHKDKLTHGTMNRGELAGGVKLTTAKVKDIKRKLANGAKTLILADENGVSPSCICDIKYGRRWAWVTLDEES